MTRCRRPTVGGTGSSGSGRPVGSTAPTARPQRLPARRKPERDAARRRSVRRWALPAIFGVAALAIAAVVVTGAMTTKPSAAADVSRPVLGQPTASVVVAEYADFQCRSCGAWARSVEAPFRTAFIDTGKVRLEWHDFAWIGPESIAAGSAARCAGLQGKFWPYHDLLYANQGGENSGAFPTSRLKAFGQQLGLETASFDACVDAGTFDAAVRADLADATAKGFSGTPTFVVGGQRLVGPPSLDALRAAIAAAGG